jgi:hypothetical protein
MTAGSLSFCYVHSQENGSPLKGKVWMSAMTEEEMLEKLKQIEDQARMTLSELPRQLAKDRLLLVIGLAQYMQTAITIAQSKRGEARFAPTPAADTRQ